MAEQWLVTGAASGIGAVLAKELVADGHRVLAWDVEESPLGEPVIVDLLHADEVASAAAAVTHQLDAVVHCAGVHLPTRILDDHLVEWFEKSIALHCTALLRILRGVHSQLRPGSAVVAVTTVSTDLAYESSLAYGASKAALRRIVQQLSIELGTGGVRVNAVSPGAVRTPMTEARWRDHDADLRRLAGLPIPRRAEPAEITSAIRFLASPAASYITGVELVVDGGLTAAAGQLAPVGPEELGK